MKRLLMAIAVAAGLGMAGTAVQAGEFDVAHGWGGPGYGRGYGYGGGFGGYRGGWNGPGCGPRHHYHHGWNGYRVHPGYGYPGYGYGFPVYGRGGLGIQTRDFGLYIGG